MLSLTAHDVESQWRRVEIVLFEEARRDGPIFSGLFLVLSLTMLLNLSTGASCPLYFTRQSCLSNATTEVTFLSMKSQSRKAGDRLIRIIASFALLWDQRTTLFRECCWLSLYRADWHIWNLIVHRPSTVALLVTWHIQSQIRTRRSSVRKTPSQ